jgi:hypothetical protein
MTALYTCTQLLPCFLAPGADQAAFCFEWSNLLPLSSAALITARQYGSMLVLLLLLLLLSQVL